MKALEKMAKYEDHLIAIMVLWPEVVMTIPFEITIFSKWRQVVVEIIRQLNAGLKPDLLTIVEAFPGNNEILYDLAALAKDIPSNANYAHYLNSLASLHADVEIYRSMQASMKEIANGSPASEVFGKVVNMALTKLSGNIPKFSYDAKELMILAAEKMEEAYEKKDDNNRVMTGIAKVDAVIGDFKPTNLIIVGARPAVGKTAFAVTIAGNMGFSGKRVGFFSSEMSALEIAYRAISHVSGVFSSKIRKNELSAYDWKDISTATERIGTTKLRICDKPSIKMSELVMQCRAWNMDGGLDVVIVDYLTRIKPDKSLGSQNLDIGDIATQMKNMARLLNIPVIVLAQLNRDSAKRADKTPNMSDLRDSGIIEQEADLIFLLHRETNEAIGDDKNYIIIEKNRHGEAGVDLLVNFNKPLMKWY
jgi:replicative DNA helicase